MFTVYIDDSGTAPDQKVVIAAAMVVPAANIPALNRDWADFNRGYEFQGDFHCSECAARNPHSVFANWSERKVRNALRRSRKIMKKHSCKSISVTFHKEDFAAVAPEEWLRVGGNDPFTWAFRTLLNLLRSWGIRRQVTLPFEYVIDWVEPRDREEIEMLMAQFESAYPGEFDGHYSFRKRREVPGLQCSDLLAWSAFSRSRYAFEGTPMRQLAIASHQDLLAHLDGEWYDELAHAKSSLREAIELDRRDVAVEEKRRVWYANYVAAKTAK